MVVDHLLMPIAFVLFHLMLLFFHRQDTNEASNNDHYHQHFHDGWNFFTQL